MQLTTKRVEHMYDADYYEAVTVMQLGFFGVGEANVDRSSGERTHRARAWSLGGCQ